MTSDFRPDRIEDAIEKLTNISSDLNKMIAVHEQRLNHQEKIMTYIEDTIERRREESEVKLKDVYDTIRSEDKHILDELNRMRLEAAERHEKMRQEAEERHNKLHDKIAKVEKIVWMYIGGITLLVFVINAAPFFSKLLK